MKKFNLSLFLFCFLICALAGAFGSLFTFQAIPTWYVTLVKPALNPPNFVFGPAWTLLYFLMSVSLYKVLVAKLPQKLLHVRQTGLMLFFAQLVLNALWSLLFFGAHMLLISFIEIVLLWIAIVGTIVVFKRISKVAALLLIPYLLWVTFAAYLNFSVFQLNTPTVPSNYVYSVPDNK
ncbi:MAG: TspO/MBR family protein [Patescibacteria group bacterium]|jgi:tryptophan-rich sensory protein